jgi:hypothetical protein
MEKVSLNDNGKADGDDANRQPRKDIADQPVQTTYGLNRQGERAHSLLLPRKVVFIDSTASSHGGKLQAITVPDSSKRHFCP